MSNENPKVTSLEELGALWVQEREHLKRAFAYAMTVDFDRLCFSYKQPLEDGDANVLLWVVLGSISIPEMRGLRNHSWEGRYEYYSPTVLDKEMERLGNEFWKLREWYRDLAYSSSPGARKIPGEVLEFLASKGLRKHFIRVSSEDPNQWVYTPDETYGKSDRQIRMRPGKMLKKLLPDVPDTTIQAVATAYTQGTVEYPLQFATTREEIKRVYINGPSSCMSHNVGNFGDTLDNSNTIHPCEAYATEDCAVAFIEDFASEITARAVVNRRDKLYARMYGNDTALEPALARAGYRHREHALEGCRLLKLTVDGKILAPYPDGMAEYHQDYKATVQIRVEDDHLVVTSDSEMDYRTDTAVLGTLSRRSDEPVESDEAECECCNEYVHASELVYVEGSRFSGDVCRYCLDNDGSFHTAIVEDAYPRTANREWMHERDTVYIECIDEHVAQSVMDRGPVHLGIVWSDHHNKWICEDSAVWIESTNDYVDGNRVDTVYTRDECNALKEDCVELHDGDWVEREGADVVQLSEEYSENAGEWALREDVRPALGADEEDCTCWVLAEEVIEYAGLEFYRRDCIKVPQLTSPTHKWVPLIAVFRHESGDLVEAQMELDFRDEARLWEPLPETEVEEEEFA